MKNLTFASLRGTKTAINCRTKSEAEQVEKICGFDNVARNWRIFEENFCVDTTDISIKFSGLFYSILKYKKENYTIIPAADFIAANSVNPEPPTDYIPLFNHLANEHDLTLTDSELREIALKVPVLENSLIEKIENLKKLISGGLIEKMPKIRQNALVELIGQIEAEAKKVFER